MQPADNCEVYVPISCQLRTSPPSPSTSGEGIQGLYSIWKIGPRGRFDVFFQMQRATRSMQRVPRSLHRAPCPMHVVFRALHPRPLANGRRPLQPAACIAFGASRLSQPVTRSVLSVLWMMSNATRLRGSASRIVHRVVRTMHRAFRALSDASRLAGRVDCHAQDESCIQQRAWRLSQCGKRTAHPGQCQPHTAHHIVVRSAGCNTPHPLWPSPIHSR